jgi:hypothetical protein
MFAGFFRYTEEEFKELWENAIFVVDTNVLLNFYKYTTKDTTKSLFNILKKLKEAGRLFIPYQVALEYFFNYEENMNKQREGLDLLVTKLMNLKEKAEQIFREVSNNYPYIINDNFKFVIDDLEQLNQKLQEQLDKELKSLPDVEEIHKNIMELLKDIIGKPYDQKRIDEIEKEGKVRYQHKVPPGWEDKDDRQKQNFRTYGGIRYQQLYGDLIVWKQMIDKAEKEKKPIIFITEEKKEDWWEKEGGKIKRPQPHLIQEFLEQTKGQKFYMYRIDSFVKYAKDYLDANVSEEDVENITTQVENIRKTEENIEHLLLEPKTFMNKVLSYLSEDEKEKFYQMLESSYDTGLNAPLSNFMYSKAIDWALNRVASKLEDRLKILINEMAAYQQGDAILAFNTLQNLPDNLEKRIEILLDTIEYLKDKIRFYESIY